MIKGKIEESFFARLIIDGKRCGMVVEDGAIAVDWATKVASGAPLNDYINNMEKAMENVSTDEEAASHFYKAFEENKTNAIGPWAFYNYLMCKPLNLSQLEEELKNVPASYLELKRVKDAVDNVKAQAVTAEGQMFTDFTVTKEDAPADTHRAMTQLDIPWPVIVGNQKLTEPTKIYGIMGIPHIIIFDPEGRIISRGLQGKKLADAIEACMAK